MLAILLVLLQLALLIGMFRLLAQARLWRKMKGEEVSRLSGSSPFGSAQDLRHLARGARAFGSEAQARRDDSIALNSLAIKSDAVLTQARQDARKMLEEAYLKAGQIVMEGKDFRQGAMKALGDKLEAAAKEELEQFRGAMRQAQEESVNSIQNVSKSIESKVSAELAAFHDALIAETVGAQKQAQEVLKRELTAASEDVASYKQALTRELDEKVFTVVNEVARKVMSEGLSEKEHEALVVEALEEAKKRHLI